MFRLLAICLPLLAFGAIEGLLALTAAPKAPDPLATVFQELEDDRFYEPDPELFWRFRPGQVIDSLDDGFAGATINGSGLRGPEVPERRAADEFRVLCLGDSITFGLGLADDQTIAHRLRQRLGKAAFLQGRRVSVVNAGVPGYTAVQAMRLYDRLRGVEPDVVVFWLGMNDAKPANGVPDSEITAAALAQDDEGAFLRLRTVAWVRSRFAAPPTSARRVPPDQFEAITQRLASEAAEGGPAVVFVETPERMGLIQRELEVVLEQARLHRAEQALLPRPLASPYAPSRLEIAARNFRLVDLDGVPTLDYPGGDEHEVLSIADIERRVGALDEWRQALDALHRRLPGPRVTADALIPVTDRASAIEDNCHPRPQGAELAARALAQAIERALASR